MKASIPVQSINENTHFSVHLITHDGDPVSWDTVNILSARLASKASFDRGHGIDGSICILGEYMDNKQSLNLYSPLTVARKEGAHYIVVEIEFKGDLYRGHRITLSAPAVHYTKSLGPDSATSSVIRVDIPIDAALIRTGAIIGTPPGGLGPRAMKNVKFG